MSNNDKGGSANPPPTPPPSTPPATPPPNKTAQISIDQVMVDLETTKQELKAAKDTIADLTTQLKAANDVLESQTKAKLIADILPRSNYTVEDLTKMGIDQLEEMKSTLDRAKLPTFKNIRLGPTAADEAKAPNLTVGDLSVVTEAKRQAAARRA